jgi:hypothetical protein
MSVRAEILRGILKIIVLGLVGKNSFKNTGEVDFQFMQKENSQKYPFLGRLNRP